jgi:hypothetical protein
MTSEELTSMNYIYVPVSVKERLPDLMVFVQTIDIDGELIVYRRTEFGWNMRDSRGDNTPNDNKEIICWLEKKVIFSEEVVGSLQKLLNYYPTLNQ